MIVKKARWPSIQFFKLMYDEVVIGLTKRTKGQNKNLFDIACRKSTRFAMYDMLVIHCHFMLLFGLNHSFC